MLVIIHIQLQRHPDRMRKAFRNHPRLTMYLMTTSHYHRGFATGHMSQANKQSCWGLNPGSPFLPDSRTLTFNSCGHLIQLLRCSILDGYDPIKSSPLEGYVECDTYRERGWRHRNIKIKTEKRPGRIGISRKQEG